MLYQTRNPHGGDIYDQSQPIALDFSANTNPFGTPPRVLEAMRQALGQVHHYPDPYCRALVEAIAEFEGVPREYILCGNGAADLIYSYCEAVRPQSAAELAPTFSEYSLGLKRVGGTVQRYVLKKEEAFLPDGRFLRWLEETRPQVIFLCNPNNPTGQLIPSVLLEEILDFCHRTGARLFLDECFLDLSEGGRSLKHRLADHPELFLLKAFTKSYGMAGVRLGYGLCSDPALLSRMAETTQPWNVSTLAQAAGVAALKEQAFLTKTRALIAAERPWMKMQLEALGFWVCPASANYLFFQGAPGLCEALKPQGIALRDCANYPGLGPGWYRTAVRLHSQNQQLMAALAALNPQEG